MKILVTGGEGQLAKSLEQVIKKNIFLATKDVLDVTKESQVDSQIKKHKPDIVIHLASLTRGDESAKNPTKAKHVNVEGTKNVIKSIIKHGGVLLFVSTNEVFDGEKKTTYTEKDIPNPITVIGETKYDAEKLIVENLEKYFIIRTSWLYSKWSSNFLHAVLSKARKDKKVELVYDEISSPTYSLDLALAIKKLIRTKKFGIYNLSNKGTVSRLDFAKKAFELYGLKDVDIAPIKLEKYPRISKPPLFTPLSSKKAKSIGIEMPSWEDALRRFSDSVKI